MPMVFERVNRRKTLSLGEITILTTESFTCQSRDVECLAQDGAVLRVILPPAMCPGLS